MTAEEFARLLDGREYGDKMSREEGELAAENRLFVFFGYSDDSVLIKGIIDDQVYGDVTIAKTTNTPYWTIFTDEVKELWETVRSQMGLPINDFIGSTKNFTIKALEEPEDFDGYWLITTDVPHATFDIMEDDDLFCRGIVVSESDVLEFLNNRGNA